MPFLIVSVVFPIAVLLPLPVLPVLHPCPAHSVQSSRHAAKVTFPHHASLAIPTVSPLMIPLVYCHINSLQRAVSVEKPWPGGAKRMDGGHRITWNGEAIGSLLLPCAPPGCP